MADSVYFIDNDVQQRVLTIEDAIEVTERMYREWAAGRATIRPKTNMYVYDDDGEHRYGFSTMEGGSQELGVVAIRIKSDVQPIQRELPPPGTSLPTSASKGAGEAGMFCGLVYLFSTHTGAPLAILNDGYIQHVRVAASAAVAAKHLAREDAETLCILGSQWMARTHAPAMCAVRPIKRIRVYSPDREHREAFAKEMAGRLEIAVEVMDSPQAAVEGADIVSCCTNSFHHPVLSGEWLEDGTFISNVLPSELGEDALARVSYTVKNQPLRSLADHVFEAGSPPPGVSPRSEGAGWLRQVDERTPLLSEVVSGTARGRGDRQEVTFFSNNEGTGLQFAAVGALVLERLREHPDPGVKTLPIEWFLQDIPD
ncbi:MAG: ornithine cyclodeaminase family protein [Chloroflexi bacterium]|nr:ornithine cyclodeaminase family protein [Chloroflexota bacterium]